MTRDEAVAIWMAACEGKRAYLWRNTAESEARHVSSQQDRRQAAYICPFCDRWHVGGPVGDRRREIIEAAAELLKAKEPSHGG